MTAADFLPLNNSRRLGFAQGSTPGDKPMHLLLCCNSSYFPNAAVAAVSAAANTAHRPLHIHLMTTDADPQGCDGLRRSLAAFPGVQLLVHPVDSTMISDFFVDGFLTAECYLRLLAPEILPPEIERVVYLDSDVVVLSDLSPLASVNLGKALVGAAPDYPDLPGMTDPARLRDLGIATDVPYVNSGVLVMDVAGWRREDVARRMCDFIRLKGSALAFHDQDAINAVLVGRIKRVDPRWNLQVRLYRCGRDAYPRALAATVEARRRPGIIHFTGSEKPWLFRKRAARKGSYVRYQRMTAFDDANVLRRLSWAERIEYRLDRELSLLGVDYLQVLYLARRSVRKLGQALMVFVSMRERLAKEGRRVP